MSYDPMHAPDAEEWTALDESTRIVEIEMFHEQAGIELPDLQLHATIHTAVENMIANDHPDVPAAMAKLIRQGLDRHDALHAVGAVFAKTFYDRLRKGEQDDGERDSLEKTFRRRLEKLTAKRWRKGQY